MSLHVDLKREAPSRSAKAVAAPGAGSVGRNSAQSTWIQRRVRRFLGPRRFMGPVAHRSSDSQRRPTAAAAIIVTVRNAGNRDKPL